MVDSHNLKLVHFKTCREDLVYDRDCLRSNFSSHRCCELLNTSSVLGDICSGELAENLSSQLIDPLNRPPCGGFCLL